MDRIRTAFAALQTLDYSGSVIISRGKKKWSQPIATRSSKSHGKRRVLKRGKYLHTGPRQNFEVFRASQLVLGWTDEWVKYLDCHDAPCRQRLPHESTIYMRSVDSNKQAGPLCQRPDCQSSANALVSLQRAQGRGVPQIPMHLRKRQSNTLDPHFSSSSFSTWTESPTWWGTLN